MVHIEVGIKVENTLGFLSDRLKYVYKLTFVVDIAGQIIDVFPAGKIRGGRWALSQDVHREHNVVFAVK
jgi:hypothetical protein